MGSEKARQNMKDSTRKNKIEEGAIFELIKSGYILSFNEYQIQASEDVYNGQKELTVLHPYKRKRFFNTAKGAIKYIDNSTC